MSPLLLVLSLLFSPAPGSPPSSAPLHDAERAAPAVVLMQQGATVYAKRDGVPVRSGTGRNDPVVEEVAIGAPLAVLEVEGLRLRVRTGAGNEGFIPKLNVTDVAPAGASSGGMFSVRDDLGTGQRSNVTAIRGLTPAAEKFADEQDIPGEVVRSFGALQEMSASLTREDLERFAAEGGVDPL